MPKRIPLPLARAVKTAVIAALFTACQSPASGTKTQDASTDGETYKDRVVLADLGLPGKTQVWVFTKCRFTKPILAHGQAGNYLPLKGSFVFRECVFEDSAILNQAIVEGQLSFYKCAFKKNLIMQNTTIMGPLALRECILDGDLQAENLICQREASFLGTTFFGIASLQSAIFWARPLFGNAIFHKPVDLTMARFENGAAFDYTKFLAKADLTDVQSRGLLSFTNGQANRLILRRILAQRLARLINFTLTDSLEVAGSRFEGGFERK